MQLHIVHSGRGAISPLHVQRVRELSSADTFQVLWHKLCRQLAGGTLSIVLTYRTQYQHSGGAQTHALSIVQLTVYPPDTKRPAKLLLGADWRSSLRSVNDVIVFPIIIIVILWSDYCKSRPYHPQARTARGSLAFLKTSRSLERGSSVDVSSEPLQVT